MFATVAMALPSAIHFFVEAQECHTHLGGVRMRPHKETPRLGEARGARHYRNDDRGNFTIPASTWWGAQPCTCRGAGECLTCRRWHRSIVRIESRRGVMA
jgi:hypothetical protein